MQQINSTLSSYLQDNFYPIYPDEGIDDITKADLIIIGVIHPDERFQTIYQTFINLFPAALVLIQNVEREKLVKKHEEYEMSWGIHPHITVRGWNNVIHIQALKGKCSNTYELAKIQNIERYCEINKIELVKNNQEQKQILINSMCMENELFTKNSLEAQNYSLCQNSMLETIYESLDQKNRPVILVGGYINVKITPNGYKHPLLEKYVENQLKAASSYCVPFPENNDIIGSEPLENLPEPQWRQKFHQMFKDKKIVLLVHKPFIIDLAKFFDKTMDHAIYRLENKLF